MFRHKLHAIALLFSLLTLGGCQTTTTSNATLVLTNGAIYTVNPEQPWAEAVVIKNSKIAYIGNQDGAKKYLDDDSQVIDLKGKLVLPGIHDTHLHPLEAGSDRVSCILDTDLGITDNLNIVADCARNHPGSDWLLGWGHSLESLLETESSPVALLDAVESERPIAIMEFTSHSVWVNSKALELAGIDAQTPPPTGGAILKDTNGEPNGILLDAAGDLVFELALAPTPALKRANYEGLLYGLEQVAKNGITSIVDARVYWQRGYLDAWYKAQAEGTLTARTVLSLWAYPDMEDSAQLAKLKSMYSNDPESMLRVNQIKLYSDGILHNATAALHDPYLDYFAEVGAYGLNYFNAQRLAHYTAELEKTGFNMHIHAIGDRGVTEALDAIAFAQNQNGKLGRHRITHVEMVQEADKPRFAELDVIADFQLAGDFTKPEHHGDMAPLIGQRAYSMLPVRDLYNSGATITLSSDWDVSSLSPFVGMQNALTRGDQSLPDLAAVIEAYTLNGAYVMGQEDKTGSLEPGKYGDMIVLDRNIFTIPKEQISKTQVEMTIVGGEIVYQQ